MAGGRVCLGAALMLIASLVGCIGNATPQGAVPEERIVSLLCPDPCAVPIDRGTRWEPSVTVDPSDASRIVAASMDQGYDAQGVRYSWPLAHVSHDGGATWTTVRPPMGSGQSPDHPLFVYNHADDPMVLFLSDGTLLYTALVYVVTSAAEVGFADTATSIALWRSTDGGRTFLDVQLLQEGSSGTSITAGPGYRMHDKQWLSQGADGTILMAWNTNERRTAECFEWCTRTFATASTDAGRSWSEPSLIYDGVASGAFPLVLDDGSWVVSYRETSDATVHVALSTDRGATWTTNTTIDSTTKFPVLAKTAGPGPTRERVYMAYPMTGEQDGQPDVPQTVTLRWSDDGGRTWSEALAIDATRAHARTSPALASTADGGAIVTYWHPTGEGDDASAQLRAVAVAPDGTLSERLVLDTHEGHTRTTGDYMGLAPLPTGEGAFAVWNAGRGSDQAITGARLTT